MLMSDVLFITRKLRGKGGMQQHTQDLWRAFRELCGEQSILVGPRSICGYIFFPPYALFCGVRAARKGYVIHLGDLALSPLARLIKLFVPSAKITAVACGLDVLYPRRLYQWILARSLASLDRVVCISNATANAVRSAGVDDEKIVTIPCGIWMDAVAVKETQEKVGPPHLVSIGRLVPRKGVLWFVKEVLPQLLQEHPGLTYTVVGTGEEERLIKKLVQDRALIEAVNLIGGVDDTQRDQLLSDADCLVVPNVPIKDDMEGFGIVCIEASSRGVPVAAARIEGLTDAVLEGKTGLFFESGNPKDSADTIGKLLSAHLDPASISLATQEQYGWDQLLSRYSNALFS